MAYGLDERRTRRMTSLPYSSENKRAAINAENSLIEFKRERDNVRRYVRTSAEKLKWTPELHKCFMRAVDRLGGQHKATPKRILEHMKKDGITIAHIKSHLQMYRSGKINAAGLSKSDFKSWQGGQWQCNNSRPLAAPVIGPNPAQSRSRYEEMSESSEFEPAMALIQLRKEGRGSDSGDAATELLRGKIELLRGSKGDEAFQLHLLKTYEERMQLEDLQSHVCIPVVELNDYIQSRANKEQELHQQDLGQSSTCPTSRPSPSLESFLSETSTTNHVDVIDSLSGSKRKAEDIELNLTMATRSRRPSLQFFGLSTPEEASLNLALSGTFETQSTISRM